MRIMLLDAWGDHHVGNDALLEQSVNLLNGLFPGSTFVVSAAVPDSFAAAGRRTVEYLVPLAWSRSRLGRYRRRASGAAWMAVNTLNLAWPRPLMSPRRYSFGGRRHVLDCISEADLVVSIAGEGLRDDSPSTFARLHGWWTAARLGRPVVIFPQSIGPLYSRLSRLAARRVLRRMDLICPRDLPSIGFLRELEVPEARWAHVQDVAIHQPFAPPELARGLLRELLGLNGDRPMISVTPSQFIGKEIQGSADLLECIAPPLLALARSHDVRIVILPANLPRDGVPEADHDLRISEQLFHRLREHLKDRVHLNRRILTAYEYKGLLALMSVHLSTRMHSMILATGANVPTMAIGTQRKIRAFMEQIGQEEWALPLSGLRPEMVRERLLSLFEEREAISERIRGAYEALRARQLSSLREAMGRVDGLRDRLAPRVDGPFGRSD
jgi:polysaccharide pyruvyl transferase WcaK-like protein